MLEQWENQLWRWQQCIWTVWACWHLLPRLLQFFVQPRQVLNFFIILSLHACVRDLQDLVACTQQVLSKKFLVLHCRSSPATQSSQYSVNKEILYLIPRGIYVSGYALEWWYGFKWIYTFYMSISHRYSGWPQTQTNSRQKITLIEWFCTLIFPTPLHNFQCTKTVGKFSLRHIWQSPAFSLSYAQKSPTGMVENDKGQYKVEVKDHLLTCSLL